MSARSILRRGFHAVLRQPAWNAVVRAALSPLARFLPARWLERVPVVGRVTLVLPDSRRFVLTSDGRENLASVLYWGGLDAFEPETRVLFESLLPRCRIVLDVGAYVGFYAVIAALDAPEREVHAFEPVPQNFERLLANLRANRLEGVRAVRAAAGDHDGEVPIHIPDGVWLPSHSSIRAGFRQHTRSLAVRSLRLDTYAEENHLGRIDLIKIDTEGSEPEVLEGARRRLARDRPWILCEVLAGLTEDRLNALLGGLGYEFLLVTGEGLVRSPDIRGDRTYRHRNFLFAPAESVESLPDPFRRPGRIR